MLEAAAVAKFAFALFFEGEALATRGLGNGLTLGVLKGTGITIATTALVSICAAHLSHRLNNRPPRFRSGTSGKVRKLEYAFKIKEVFNIDIQYIYM